MDSKLNWHKTETIELVSGYTVPDASGRLAETLFGASVACEGGFLHIAVAGSRTIHVISAPALRLIAYLSE